MSIETLDDIAEELADQLGIYGGCPQEFAGYVCPDETCNCRMGFVGQLKVRIREAVAVEQALQMSERVT